MIEQKCSEFLSGGDSTFDWDELTNHLNRDANSLSNYINDPEGIPFETSLKNVTFTNQFGN